MPSLLFLLAAARPWRRCLWLLVLGLSLLGPAPAPAVPNPTAQVQPTMRAQALPPLAEGRRFSARELQRLRRDSALQYREAPPATNPLTRWWREFWEWVAERMFGPGTGPWWKTLFYLVAAVAVGLIVSQLLGLNPADFLRRRGQRLPVPFEQLADDIHEETLPQRLREAEEQGQWRLATRLGYLLVLKALADRGLILWKPDKTNHDYQQELRSASASRLRPFAELTRQFEYVWYGEFDLAAAQYELVRAERQEFLVTLETTRAA